MEQPVLPVKTQAELLGVSRSSLYYRPVGPTEQGISIKHRIDELYTEHPYYGSRRMTAVLRREGILINRKAVQRHMREMGIEGVAPKPNSSRPAPEHKVYPYLLRGLEVTCPDHVWSTDITYIRLSGGWMYLVAVIDWYSRYVVAWQLEQTLGLEFVLEAVGRALQRATPQICNSDQGSQFTSPRYLEMLEWAGVRISMDGRGRASDNVFVERLWRSVKYEEVYLNTYENPRQARQGLSRYFEYYNHERPHQALGYRTPAEVYLDRFETQQKGVESSLQSPALLSN